MKKSAIIPFIITLSVTPLIFLLHWYYYDSGLYLGSVDVINTGYRFEWSSLLPIFLLFFPKFFIYDYWGRKLINYSKAIWKTVIFWLFYVGAILLDIRILQAASEPKVDAGFAIIGVVMITLPLLLLGLIVLLLVSLVQMRFKK